MENLVCGKPNVMCSRVDKKVIYLIFGDKNPYQVFVLLTNRDSFFFDTKPVIEVNPTYKPYISACLCTPDNTLTLFESVYTVHILPFYIGGYQQE